MENLEVLQTRLAKLEKEQFEAVQELQSILKVHSVAPELADVDDRLHREQLVDFISIQEDRIGNILYRIKETQAGRVPDDNASQDAKINRQEQAQKGAKEQAQRLREVRARKEQEARKVDETDRTTGFGTPFGFEIEIGSVGDLVDGVFKDLDGSIKDPNAKKIVNFLKKTLDDLNKPKDE